MLPLDGATGIPGPRPWCSFRAPSGSRRLLAKADAASPHAVLGGRRRPAPRARAPGRRRVSSDPTTTQATVRDVTEDDIIFEARPPQRPRRPLLDRRPGRDRRGLRGAGRLGQAVGRAHPSHAAPLHGRGPGRALRSRFRLTLSESVGRAHRRAHGGCAGSAHFLPIALVWLTSSASFAQPPEKLPYLDPSLPTAQRAADLVSRLTLEEKVLQMQSTAPRSRAWASRPTTGGTRPCTASRRAAPRCSRRRSGSPRPGTRISCSAWPTSSRRRRARSTTTR